MLHGLDEVQVELRGIELLLIDSYWDEVGSEHPGLL